MFILKRNTKAQDDILFEKFMKTHYGNEIAECLVKHSRSPLYIDYNTLIAYFNQNGREIDDKNIKIMLNKFEKDINVEREISEKISIFLKDVPQNVALQDLDADWNSRFISTTAMIKTITDTAPMPITAVYDCEECHVPHIVPMDTTDKIEVPSRCLNCGSKRLKFNSDASTYKNYAYMILEVPLEIRQNGKTKSFKAYLEDYLATSHHNIQAGDVCEVVGWFRVKPSDSGGLEFIIEVQNIVPVGKDLEESKITEKDKELITELSQEEDVFQRFVESIAPDMYGYETVKKALVLQLFEGLRPQDSDKVTGEDRWTIHILIIGDPGVGKSKLSQGVSLHAPKSITTNGAGATKVGLLSALNRDPLSNAWISEAGAIVLADSGLLIIDEFDKLHEEAQTGLNEPMEQLMVSSAKAGVVQTLTARTSVLALANPKYSHFNEIDSMNKQLDIVDSTLSRFDLVFAIRDIIDPQRDEQLARAILYKEYEKQDKSHLIEDSLFKKYINYAKLNVFPKLSDEANEYLIDIFKKVRIEANENPDNKPITMRELLGMQRLTIARAKVELREVATLEDAIECVEIYTKALESIGLDLATVGEKQSVRSHHEVQLIKDAENMFRELFDEYGLFVDKEELDEILLEIKVRCASIKTKLTADDIYKEAYHTVRKEYD